MTDFMTFLKKVELIVKSKDRHILESIQEKKKQQQDSKRVDHGSQS